MEGFFSLVYLVMNAFGETSALPGGKEQQTRGQRRARSQTQGPAYQDKQMRDRDLGREPEAQPQARIHF